MSLAQMYRSRGGSFRNDCKSSFGINHSTIAATVMTTTGNHHDYSPCINHQRDKFSFPHVPKRSGEHNFNYNRIRDEGPSVKRRKFSASSWECIRRPYNQQNSSINGSSTCFSSSLLSAPTTSDANGYASVTCKRDRATFEDGDDMVFMSRDEIERYSPSRKDGIDITRENYLRYSYCTYLQNLGMRLELPQTTIATAMVLCHRFFIRRSHACHDRFLIATASLFLAAKSEETARPLNSVLTASSELLHKQNLAYLSYLLPVDWFEQYRERVTEAEQMILTTLNFELNVQHPYAPLTSILEKLGLSQSILLNVALGLVGEGVYRRLACSAV